MHVKPIALLLSLTLLQGCAAAVVAGTAGAMSAANDRRTIGVQIDDNNIEIKGTLALKSIDRLANHANISVVSVNGVVLLVGQVSNVEMRTEAEAALKTVPAIRRVHNQLRIGSNIGITTQTHDTWLTSKVKTKLLADENVSGNNIKVVTENAEVFLMGLVAPIEAEQAVEIARNISGVERVIKAFEYL
ncbi:osmotically-inducible protein OsmY [Pseudoalteromonas citrea]|uniref:Osmotically-inducible protein OsmY n=2 Tax=Pseudoalteromonas TaxID=53246 RepID=A0A5S3XP71_9GAMM|nr:MULTISPECIES: division/outer membrane stress-associated lipid-binding lipoprotein [Pseudoalteromonas]RJE76870.1 BON domain-containing protein [Pseudoalteromonas sp. MSK9-3]TMP45641.1 osmotically-inducible protein OsmY [Pseudoalteromonas citrea]TMP59021.1 osmotically-inducible protein OsmY [Pseudoalteromonas citrea]